MVLTLHCHNLSQRIRFVGASFASFFCGHQRCVKYVLFRQFCVALWQNYALESKKYCLTLSNNKEGRNSIGQDFFQNRAAVRGCLLTIKKVNISLSLCSLMDTLLQRLRFIGCRDEM